MRKLENAIVNPVIYIVWAVLVVVALVATYFADPYIFAVTAFGLAGISAVVGLVGLSAALLSRTASSRAKAWVVVSVTAAAAALVAAFALLGSFNWA